MKKPLTAEDVEKFKEELDVNQIFGIYLCKNTKTNITKINKAKMTRKFFLIKKKYTNLLEIQQVIFLDQGKVKEIGQVICISYVELLLAMYTSNLVDSYENSDEYFRKEILSLLEKWNCFDVSTTHDLSVMDP